MPVVTEGNSPQSHRGWGRRVGVATCRRLGEPARPVGWRPLRRSFEVWRLQSSAGDVRAGTPAPQCKTGVLARLLRLVRRFLRPLQKPNIPISFLTSRPLCLCGESFLCDLYHQLRDLIRPECEPKFRCRFCRRSSRKSLPPSAPTPPSPETAQDRIFRAACG